MLDIVVHEVKAWRTKTGREKVLVKLARILIEASMLLCEGQSTCQAFVKLNGLSVETTRYDLIRK